MAKLLAAVSEYENFDKKMKERSRYDYDDMIIWVLKAFRENEEMLRRYQERYHTFWWMSFRIPAVRRMNCLSFY